VNGRPEQGARKRERGSSLFETVLALGLIAGVLGSVAGLFVMGAGGVHSGRRATEALAAAQTIIEEMRSRGFHQTYEEFGFDGSAAAYVIDTRVNSRAAAWQSELDGRLGGWAEIEIGAIDAGGPLLRDCTQMQVRVTVHWTEGTRQRSVQLHAVRM
jgi:hypothetical protein